MVDNVADLQARHFGNTQKAVEAQQNRNANRHLTGQRTQERERVDKERREADEARRREFEAKELSLIHI